MSKYAYLRFHSWSRGLIVLLWLWTSIVTANSIVVIDAGSSGTRWHQYHLSEKNITLTSHATNAIGIATLAHHHGTHWTIDKLALNRSLRQLQQSAHALHQSMEPIGAVFLYATAGMRLVPTGTQHQLMRAAARSLSAMGYSHVHSAVLDGQDEALFDWLAVNSESLMAGHRNLHGIVDLGGASVEVAFALPRYEVQHVQANVRRLHLFGRSYRIYTNSFLGVGTHQLAGAAAHLYPSAMASCYPSGAVARQSFSYHRCRQVLRLTLRRFEPLLPPSMVTMVPDRFRLLGAFYYGHQFLGGSLQTWPKATPRICAQTWSDFKRLNPRSPLKYLRENCLNATYGHVLLEQVFGVRQMRRIRFEFAKQSSWALGVAVAHLAGVHLP
jgi:hypothetical protein